MSNTYPPKFVKAFKRIFPKCTDLHELLDQNDMSEEAQRRITEQRHSLHIYSLPNEEIVRLFKNGQEKQIFTFARKQIKAGKDIRTLSALWPLPRGRRGTD